MKEMPLCGRPRKPRPLISVIKRPCLFMIRCCPDVRWWPISYNFVDRRSSGLGSVHCKCLVGCLPFSTSPSQPLIMMSILDDESDSGNRCWHKSNYTIHANWYYVAQHWNFCFEVLVHVLISSRHIPLDKHSVSQNVVGRDLQVVAHEGNTSPTTFQCPYPAWWWFDLQWQAYVQASGHWRGCLCWKCLFSHNALHVVKIREWLLTTICRTRCDLLNTIDLARN